MNARDNPNTTTASRIMEVSMGYRIKIFRGGHPRNSYPRYEDVDNITGGQDTFDLTYMNWKPSMK